MLLISELEGRFEAFIDLLGVTLLHVTIVSRGSTFILIDVISTLDILFQLDVLDFQIENWDFQDFRFSRERFENFQFKI